MLPWKEQNLCKTEKYTIQSNQNVQKLMENDIYSYIMNLSYD